eukprot:11221272-Lingulodinium_polyedra.AAC.1
MERASVRCASRCVSGRSIRSHRCTTFAKRCTTMSRPSAAAAARKSHARASHSHTNFWRAHG